MLPASSRTATRGMAKASSTRAVGPLTRSARRTTQRTSVVLSAVVRKAGVRQKFMTEDNGTTNERSKSSSHTERFAARSAKPGRPRVRDRFKDEAPEEQADSSWNGTHSSSNGNGFRVPVESSRPSPSSSPRSKATPRTRRGSPSRFDSGIERLPEPPASSAPTANDITERFMSRARDRPASPRQPAALRTLEPTPSIVAAERARSPDPMRAPARSVTRTVVSRGRVRDRFMDPPEPALKPTLPPPPAVKPLRSYASPPRPTSRTPSPIRRNRMGPTAQRLALVSQERTKEASQPVPSPSYIDVEPLPTPDPWTSALPTFGIGIPFFEIMSFQGAAPEIINGRLAMLGFFAMLCTEFETGDALLDQYAYTAESLPYMFVIWTVASLVPLLRGIAPENATFGPFTPLAEKWNGRLAMVGLVGVVLFEALKGRALFF